MVAASVFVSVCVCLALPVLVLFCRRERAPLKQPHMVPGRKFMLGRLLGCAIHVANFLRLTPGWVRKRVTMTEMRAAACFPLEQDTLPDRDAFEALYGEALAFIHNGGNAIHRLDALGIALNKLGIFNTLKIRKLLAEAPPVDNLRRLPRLVVVGQPRTGTTILSRLINALPEVWGPTLRQARAVVIIDTHHPSPCHCRLRGCRLR